LRSRRRNECEDVDVNTLMLRILREALGIEKKKRNVLHDDLDYLAGTWNTEDADAFERATAMFEAVDKDMWK
jgi:hypothetical protein